MKRIKSILGIPKKDIREVCVLIPFISRYILNNFGIDKMSKGWPYLSASTKYFTLIYTRVGTTFVGDAVLCLQQTRCKYLFFIGTCGLVLYKKSDINIGDIVLPSTSWAMESFSQLLKGEFELAQKSMPDKFLMDECKKYFNKGEIHMVSSATMGSLQMEEESISFFKKKDIRVVDMETSAFLNAAAKTNKKATALLVVSDIIKEVPFYEKQTKQNKKDIQYAIRKTINAVTYLAKRLSCDG